MNLRKKRKKGGRWVDTPISVDLDEAKRARERQALRAATIMRRKKKKERRRNERANQIIRGPVKSKRVALISEFYDSPDWKRLRYLALKRSNGCCQCCGAGPDQGAVLNVNHVKPRRDFPELALDLNNLQVLCAWCNQGKGNWDETDWRVERLPDLIHLQFLRERGLLN